ncbi:metallophosphoesterase family protein [Desulfosporosinus sp. SB140]|uniref:metallophosphoesterase family protein n=1 Tax=Desulfosporosinus paludis TaxID=3115649 RepID=UPI00388FA3C6
MDFAFLSETQFNWLEEVLNKNKKPYKPIFVFLHQPMPYMTLGGLQRGYVLQWQRLNDILSQHPEVILFNGHTHYEIDYKNMVSQANFAIFNSSSLAYPIDKNRNLIKNSAPGLVVEVYEEKVVIKGREFLTQDWINAAEIAVLEQA